MRYGRSSCASRRGPLLFGSSVFASSHHSPHGLSSQRASDRIRSAVAIRWARRSRNTVRMSASRSSPSDGSSFASPAASATAVRRAVKDDSTGPQVVVTHSRPDVHWEIETEGSLVINLEDMWDDYEQAVTDFIDSCRLDEAHGECVLRRWRDRKWTAQLAWVVDRNVFAISGVQVSAAPATSSGAPRRRRQSR